jgi:hypothetical protein
MIHHLQIEIDNGKRLLDALVEISTKWYGESEFASGHSDYGWTCLSLTEVTEDGTIIKHHIPDYYSHIEEIISNL